jgi:hypothetical protein
MIMKKIRRLLLLCITAISQFGISLAVAKTFTGPRTGASIFAYLKVNEDAGVAHGFPGPDHQATTAEWRAKWR